MIKASNVKSITHYEKRTGQIVGKPEFVVEVKYKGVSVWSIGKNQHEARKNGIETLNRMALCGCL